MPGRGKERNTFGFYSTVECHSQKLSISDFCNKIPKSVISDTYLLGGRWEGAKEGNNTEKDIINSAAMNIGVQVSLSLLVSSVCMPSSGIAGSLAE